jgi:hypothetical protein
VTFSDICRRNDVISCGLGSAEVVREDDAKRCTIESRDGDLGVRKQQVLGSNPSVGSSDHAQIRPGDRRGGLIPPWLTPALTPWAISTESVGPTHDAGIVSENRRRAVPQVEEKRVDVQLGRSLV